MVVYVSDQQVINSFKNVNEFHIKHKSVADGWDGWLTESSTYLSKETENPPLKALK